MRLPVLLAAALCAGCAGLLDERVWEGQRLNAVTPVEFSSFAAAGPVVEIVGAPPGGAAPDVVAAALRLPGRFPQSPFRLASAGESRAPVQGALRLVLAFSAGPADGRQLCAGGAPAAPHTGPGLEVTAALCVGPNADAAARLSHVRPLAPPDPAFTDSMRRLFDALAPRAVEFRRRGSACMLPPCD